MVLVETLDALLKIGELVAVDEGDACAKTLGASAVARGKGDGTDTIV